MNRPRHVTALAFLALVSCAALAQDAPRPQSEVFELLQMKADLEQLAPNVVARLDQQKQNIPQELFSPVREAALEAFDAARVRADYLGELERNLGRKDAEACLEFLRSPVARKLAMLEANASGPEILERAQEFAKQLRPDKATAARKALVERQIDRSGAVDAYVRRSQGLSRALNLSLARAVPPDQRPSQAQLDAGLAQLDRQMRPNFRSELIALLMFAYQTVPEDELKQAVLFYESSAGQALRAALSRSGAAVFEKATAAMVKAFEKKLTAPPAPDRDW